MQPFNASEITGRVHSLFAEDFPAGLRCTGVLDGILPGEIWLDDAENPTWGFVRETIYGTLYPAGAVDWEWLSAHLLKLRTTGEALIGIWERETTAIKPLLPPPNYEGMVLDYTDRAPGVRLDDLMRAIPPGVELLRVDAELFDLLDDRDSIVAVFGSKEKALALTFGACLRIGGKVVSEAFGAPPIRGVIEAGVGTHPDHRRKGYARLTSALLIHLCESAGYSTYWNVNAANIASVALAKDFGYQTERPYTLFGWYVSG